MTSQLSLFESTEDDLFEVNPSISDNDFCGVQISYNKRKSTVEESSTNMENYLLTLIRAVWTENRRAVEQGNKIITNDSRTRLWEILMGDEPIPTPSVGAVEECSAILRSMIPEDAERNPLIDLLREIRGK